MNLAGKLNLINTYSTTQRSPMKHSHMPLYLLFHSGHSSPLTSHNSTVRSSVVSTERYNVQSTSVSFGRSRSCIRNRLKRMECHTPQRYTYSCCTHPLPQEHRVSSFEALEQHKSFVLPQACTTSTFPLPVAEPDPTPAILTPLSASTSPSSDVIASATDTDSTLGLPSARNATTINLAVCKRVQILNVHVCFCADH